MVPPGGAIEPVISLLASLAASLLASLGSAASDLAAADCVRSTRSKRSTSLLYCALVLRLVH